MALEDSSSRILKRLGTDPLGLQIQCVRSILALGTLLTLVFNDSRTLVGSVSGNWNDSICNGAPGAGAFCLFPEHVDTVRWLLAIPCVLLILGVVPWVSGAVHLYAAFSIASNTLSVEGGDQITVNLSALLLVSSLCRPQAWGWKEARVQGHRMRFIPANVALIACGIQLAFVYFEATVVKLNSDPWTEGTAMWYWVQNGGSGLYSGVEPIARSILAIPVFSAAASWGTLVVEITLFLGCLFARKRTLRWILMLLGIGFHLSIALLLGLSTFFLAMTGALLLAFWKPRDAVPWKLFRRLYISPPRRHSTNPEIRESHDAPTP